MSKKQQIPLVLKRTKHSLVLSVLALILIVVGSCSKDDEVVQFKLATTVSPAEGGSISTTGGNFESGKEVTLTATPSQGYTFKNWSGAIKGDQNPIKVVFNADKSISANFEKMDADADGVPDDIDQCSQTGAGLTVDAQGCSQSQKDTDGDGVTDDKDNCNETPAGATVSEDGCEVGADNDSDDDGVLNSEDTCANTPFGESVDENGCSESQSGSDSDGDGIPDNLDECPETPNGETVDESGCSDSQKDTDNDGVTDNLDNCADTPEGETVDENGCSDDQKESDSDGDGVTDDIDTCAETPEGETVDETGCSDSQRDTDGDGVPDTIDQCPETAEGETVNEEGCSSVARTFVPDDKFEQQLIDLGYDDVIDDYVNTENIISVEVLAINGLNQDLTDLTGLEDFVSLTSLFISSMTTVSINLDNHPLLERFSIGFSEVEELLATSHENLEEITNNGSTINNAIITNCAKLSAMPSSNSYYDNLALADNPLLVELGGIDDTAWGDVKVENCASFEGFIATLSVRSLEFVNCASVTTINMNYVESLMGFPIQGIVLTGNQNLTDIDVRNANLSSLVINEGNAITSINLEGNVNAKYN